MKLLLDFSIFRHFITGCHYYLDGLKLVFQPGLRRFVILPLIINILIFTAFLLVARHYMLSFDQWFVNYLPSWLQWLSTILWLFFLVSFFLILVYGFVLVANMISAPFNGLLAEKVESYLTGTTLPSRSTLDTLKDFPRSIARQFSIVGYYLPRALFILILFFIPIVQAFAALIWLLFNAWMMTLTYLDYPTENHQIPIRDARAWMTRNRMMSLGFGICALTIAMVPIVNLFMIPAAVAGATKLYVTEQAHQ